MLFKLVVSFSSMLRESKTLTNYLTEPQASSVHCAAPELQWVRLQS